MGQDGGKLVFKSSRHADIAGKFGEQMILFIYPARGLSV